MRRHLLFSPQVMTPAQRYRYIRTAYGKRTECFHTDKLIFWSLLRSPSGLHMSNSLKKDDRPKLFGWIWHLLRDSVFVAQLHGFNPDLQRTSRHPLIAVWSLLVNTTNCSSTQSLQGAETTQLLRLGCITTAISRCHAISIQTFPNPCQKIVCNSFRSTPCVGLLLCREGKSVLHEWSTRANS